MSGLADECVIAGVSIHPMVLHRDARGTFAEYFVAGRDHGIDPQQWSVVQSARGVLRGMHVHARHDEYFSVISGRATGVLHDLRPDSPTAGRSMMFQIDGDAPARVIFPAGVVHGWLFHEPTVHLQATSESHDSYGDDDNWGCHWSDPDLGVQWPFAPTIVSERAEAFGSLRALAESVYAVI